MRSHTYKTDRGQRLQIVPGASFLKACVEQVLNEYELSHKWYLSKKCVHIFTQWTMINLTCSTYIYLCTYRLFCIQKQTQKTQKNIFKVLGVLIQSYLNEKNEDEKHYRTRLRYCTVKKMILKCLGVGSASTGVMNSLTYSAF